jgi:pseudaminic acid synthase
MHDEIEFERPKIVAELSGNHDGSLDRALELVRKAGEAGADAIKLQTFTPDTMTLNLQSDHFMNSDSNSLWNGNDLYSLYSRAQTPWEWHEVIFEEAKSRGMEAFSSVFDRSSIDFLETLHVPRYKIASFENIDIPLIAYAASTGKPLIISTGMASLVEIGQAVEAARKGGCTDLTLLKCTSSYPSKPSDYNLKTIPVMRDTFNCKVGLSDHSIGIGVAIASIALGVSMIEKHLTIDVNDGAIDSQFSMNPDTLSQLTFESKNAFDAIGQVFFGPTDSEKLGSRKRRRSLYFTSDLATGDVVTLNNIKSIRPGYGIAPYQLENILGLRVTKDCKYGEPVTWEKFK